MEHNDECGLFTTPKEDDTKDKNANFVCYKCHKKGHKAHQCPDVFSGGKTICQLCNQKGHTATTCWENDDNATKRPRGWKTRLKKNDSNQTDSNTEDNASTENNEEIGAVSLDMDPEHYELTLAFIQLDESDNEDSEEEDNNDKFSNSLESISNLNDAKFCTLYNRDADEEQKEGNDRAGNRRQGGRRSHRISNLPVILTLLLNFFVLPW